MSESNQLAVSQPVKASDQLATFLGIEKGMMLETLKVQCFKGKRPDEVSDAQLAAFVSTANILQVNPLVPGMLYAYPERNGGITPILGPDGVFKKLDEMIAIGKLRGYECDVKMGADGKPESATAIIHRSGEQVSAKYTAYFSEWSVTSNPNWQARPRHMLWVRAIKQAARQVIHGLPMDADEYQIAQMTNVTPEAEASATTVVRPEPPKRARKGAAAVQENVQEAQVVTEVKAAEAKPVESKTEKLAQKLADPVEVEKAVAVAESAPANAPRAFLNDGERIATEITVQDLRGLTITTADGVKPSVKAKVGGGFVGEVFHIGAGIAGQDGKPVPAAPWAIGAILRVVLVGTLNNKVKNEQGQFGKVQNFVESVAPAVAEEEGMEA